MHSRGSLSLTLLGAVILAWPVTAASPVHAVAASSDNTNFGPFTIKVEIEGVTQGVFASVEGLGSSSEVVAAVPQKDGAAVTDSGEAPGAGTREAPGALKNPHLILKRSYDPSLSGLWQWRRSVVEGMPQKRDGDIFVFNGGGQLVAHWTFHKGWPCRWEVPSLQANTREPAEEIIEIVHAGLNLESLPVFAGAGP